ELGNALHRGGFVALGREEFERGIQDAVTCVALSLVAGVVAHHWHGRIPQGAHLAEVPGAGGSRVRTQRSRWSRVSGAAMTSSNWGPNEIIRSSRNPCRNVMMVSAISS